MEPPSQFTPYLVLLGVLLIPALVFTIAFTVARMRRGKFKHQHRRPHSKR